jgi:cytochrome P450
MTLPVDRRPRNGAKPPTGAGKPVIGALLEFVHRPLDYLLETARLGDVVRIPVPGIESYMLAHPDDVERVLVEHADRTRKDVYTRDLSRVLGDGLLTSDGHFWRRQRKLVATAFTPRRVASYAEAMVDAAEREVARLRTGDVIPVHRVMSALTLDVVGRTLFDTEVKGDAAEIGAALETIGDFYASAPEAFLLLPEWVPTNGHKRFAAARARIDAVLGRILAARRALATRSPDEDVDPRALRIVDALLRARDEHGESMSAHQLRDECVTLFLAGHETTSLALGHTLHLLSLHPQVRDRVVAEVDAVLGDRRATADDFPALSFTERVVKESMRLYPPAWTMGRELLEPLEVTGGYVLPKGAQVTLSPWVTHRDARFFPNPLGFDPDRFEHERSWPRFAYFPFGGGPRICVGNRFAMVETVLVLATFVRRVRLDLVPGSRFELAPSVTLRPAAPVSMRVVVRRRESAGAPMHAA